MTLAARLAGAHDALLRGDGPNAVRHALNGLSIAPDSPDAAFLLGLAWDPRWFVRSLALAPDHLGAALARRVAVEVKPSAQLVSIEEHAPRAGVQDRGQGFDRQIVDDEPLRHRLVGDRRPIR